MDFTNTKSEYMRLVAEDWFSARWWMVAIPVAALLAAGWLVGPIFIMILVMLVCLVAPVLVMILYFNYSLTPEAIAATRPHSCRVEPDGSVTLTFAPMEERTFEPYRLPAADILSAEQRGEHTVLRIKGKPYCYVIIQSELITPSCHIPCHSSEQPSRP